MPNHIKWPPGKPIIDVILPTWLVIFIMLVALPFVGTFCWFKFIEPFLHRNHVELPEYTHTQQQESEKHFVDMLEQNYVAWEIQGGKAKAVHFPPPNDGCTAVVWYDWKPETEEEGIVVEFSLHPTRTFEKRQMALQEADFEMMLAGSVPASDYCGGRCIDPHPGRFWVDEEWLNQCVVRIFRTFEDNCQHFQDYNRCAGAWGPVNWTCCVH